MRLAPGTTIGPYEIKALIGAGGMGEVYSARDSRLKRDLAIKILPRQFVADADRLMRFQREAEVLASLNHPHIAHIYGIEESGGVRALVLELVEGPTLAERIARGPLPIDETIALAPQIARALEAAHERGVIHRDLKPANIKLTADGTVKVLDFGLAKAVACETTGAMIAESPTMTAMGTRSGILLGTAAYMSPEQARGLAVDARTDIWAFGCVLYEMLTGQMAFRGATVTDTLAAIVGREPDWTALPRATPAGVRRALRRCLAKDLKHRAHHIADVSLDLTDDDSEPAPAGIRGGRRALWPVIAGATLALIGLAGAGVAWRQRASALDRALVRLEITTPPTVDPWSLAISPDGRRVVFAACANRVCQLWLRRLDGMRAEPLRETTDATFPFWSPDSRSIGFFAERRLKRMDIDTGAVQALADAPGGRGGTWNRDGVIVFQRGPATDGKLMRIDATGGAVTPLAMPGRFPHFLSDGDHFVYYSPLTESRGAHLGRLSNGNSRKLLDTDGAVVVGSRHFFFARQGVLYAQRFDSSTLLPAGESTPVATDVEVNGPLMTAPLGVSANDTLIYRTQSSAGRRQFVWFDRSGMVVSKASDAVDALMSPAISPDGRLVAVHGFVKGVPGIWLLELPTGLLTRLTREPQTRALQQSHPVWAPDGQRVVVLSQTTLHEQPITGGASSEFIASTGATRVPTDWSRDGRTILMDQDQSDDRADVNDIWAVPADRRSQPFAVIRSPADEENAQFSADGRWIAYESNASGQFEVYVQPFPAPGPAQRVSLSGGAQARWRQDGRELFYVSLDSQLMAVSIGVNADGRTIEAGTARRLFHIVVGGALQSNSRQQYLVSPDGQRFLVNTLTEDDDTPIRVVLNWKPPS